MGASRTPLGLGRARSQSGSVPEHPNQVALWPTLRQHPCARPDLVYATRSTADPPRNHKSPPRHILLILPRVSPHLAHQMQHILKGLCFAHLLTLGGVLWLFFPASTRAVDSPQEPITLDPVCEPPEAEIHRSRPAIPRRARAVWLSCSRCSVKKPRLARWPI